MINKILSVIFLGHVIFSCAAIPKKNWGDTKDVFPVQAIRPKVSLVIKTTHTGDYGDQVSNQSESYINHAKNKETLIDNWELKYLVEGIVGQFQGSQLFEKVEISSGFEFSRTEYTIEINQTTFHRQSLKRKIWFYTTMATLGIIPYWESRNLHYYIRIIRDGKSIKSYELDFPYTVITSLFIIPITPIYTPNYQIENMRKDLFNQLFQKMLNDRLFDSATK
ncbi:MAG: hypothetical protein HOM21_11250 [Halobacteriovoraceae bacterium]|nr:hypothetical protein [Halobacteriovoraceae bacterium]